MAKLYHTTTIIPVEEIQAVLTKGQKLLGDMGIDAGYAELFGTSDDQGCNRRLLYLYMYALESWVTCTDGVNFMCESQLTKILSEIEQLFYVCQCKTN